MPYGTIKIDTVTFTDAGVDKSVSISGLVQNPTFSGSVTVTGTLSGVTVTGTTANFTSGNFTNISGGTHTITSGVFAAGSAASPSITFTGDLNTGIYSPGADQVAISTGGSGRLFVDANGNVGIADSTPQRDAGTTSLAIGDGSKSASVDLYGTVKNYAIYNGGSGQLGVFDLSASTERITLTSAGLVGVGTSSPSQLLTLQQTSAGSAVDCLFLNNSSVSNGTAVGISFGPNTTNDITRSAIIRGINESGGAGNATGLGFFTNANGGAPTQKVTITSGGLVGIGTTSPGYALHVVGTINSSDANIGFRTALTNGLFQAREFGGSSANNTLEFNIRPDSGKSGYLTFTETSVADRWSIGIQNGSDGLRFISGTPTTGTERCRIDGSGRLLVGTSTSRSVGDDGQSPLQISGTGYGGISIVNNRNDLSGPAVVLAKNRSGSVGGSTIVQNGDSIGNIIFAGADGTDIDTPGAYIQCFVDGTPGANDMPGRLVFSTTADGASSPTERMRISQNGSHTLTGGPGSSHTILTNNAERIRWNDNGSYITTLPTTGSGANVHIWTGSAPANLLMLSTSSQRYKTDIEDLDADRSNAVLNFRPVWYRSTCELDRKDWSWYGLIAEEVAEIEPRLVHWTYLDDAYEVSRKEDGTTEKTLKEDAKLVPNGVQYDRLTVLLLDLAQRQEERIAALEAKVAALESA